MVVKDHFKPKICILTSFYLSILAFKFHVMFLFSLKSGITYELYYNWYLKYIIYTNYEAYLTVNLFLKLSWKGWGGVTGRWSVETSDECKSCICVSGVHHLCHVRHSLGEECRVFQVTWKKMKNIIMLSRLEWLVVVPARSSAVTSLKIILACWPQLTRLLSAPTSDWSPSDSSLSAQLWHLFLFPTEPWLMNAIMFLTRIIKYNSYINIFKAFSWEWLRWRAAIVSIFVIL